MFQFFLFGLSVAASFAAWAFISLHYIWPWIRSRKSDDAVRALLVPHLFWFVGASFLIASVAGSSLQEEFASPAAYGDLAAMALAWVALGLLNRPAGRTAIWAFNIWGTADLLFDFYRGAFGQGFQPSALGATFYIPTVFVPFLIWSHFMIFALLVKSPEMAAVG